MLWFLAEVAIIATDIAEVIGTAIGLNLLFGIPLEIGVIITALDVFLILYLQKLGFRWVEALIMTLLGVIAVCFAVQIFLADPDLGGVIRGFAPTVEIVRNPEMLYLALGILGATVMPHNLYLHSGIVQTRAYGHSLPEKREALKYATINSTVALMFALFINASILILAAATFNKVGNTEIVELGEAHSLLSPLLGAAIAPTLFGIALAVLRHQLDGHRDAGRPDRHGRLFEDKAAALDAPADHPRHRHRPGRHRHHLVWRRRHGAAADPHPGRAVAAAFLRGLPAGLVHRVEGQDGRARRAALADRLRGAHRRRHRRAERQAAGRFRDLGRLRRTRRDRLRPALQRLVPGFRQRIDASLGAGEPAVDIVQQDFSARPAPLA